MTMNGIQLMLTIICFFTVDLPKTIHILIDENILTK
jgi:hypothetical protein